MEPLVIGNNGCDFLEVMKVLDGEQPKILYTKLFDLAINLGINGGEIMALKRQLNMENRTHFEVLRKILEIWRNDQGNNATIFELVNALRNTRLHRHADQLENRFQLHAHDANEHGLPTSLFIYAAFFLLMSMRLTIFANIQENENERANTIPSIIPYYISRNLVSRTELSPQEIFKYWSNDIFVISEINANDLYNFVDFRRCGSLEQQLRLKRPMAGYIIIYSVQDFEKISKRTSKSVHWIAYNKTVNTFTWKKTKGLKGSMLTVQKCLSLEKSKSERISEQDFTSRLTSRDSNAFILVGAAGVGKTFLLANIGMSLKETYNETVFVKMEQLILKVKPEMEPAGLAQILAEYHCVNEKCRKETSAKIMSAKSTFWVLLDGFDKLSSENIILAKSFLAKLSLLSSVKIIITTRPHYLLELEETLNVLAYELQPFCRSDIRKFLVKFWKFLTPSLEMTKLEQFVNKTVAKYFLEGPKQGEIFGQIALHCKLIGEAFHDAVIRNNNSIQQLDKSHVELIPTVAQLYDYIVSRVLHNFEDKVQVHRLLALEAISKISPESKKILRLVDPPGEIKTGDVHLMLKTGLIQTDISVRQTRSFVHDTFAEYFEAWFILEVIKYTPMTTSKANDDLICEYIWNHLLMLYNYEPKYWNTPQSLHQICFVDQLYRSGFSKIPNVPVALTALAYLVSIADPYAYSLAVKLFYFQSVVYFDESKLDGSKTKSISTNLQYCLPFSYPELIKKSFSAIFY